MPVCVFWIIVIKESLTISRIAKNVTTTSLLSTLLEKSSLNVTDFFVSKISMILFFSILAFSIIVTIVAVVALVNFAGTPDFGEIVDEFY